VGVLVLLFIVVPIAELYVIVQASHAFGVLNTLGLLVLISIVGGWLVKHEGMRVWRRFQQQVAQGAVPSREIADGVLLLAAGVLLLAPGFITDALGIVLLLPPVRAVVRGVLVRRTKRRTARITATYGGPLSHDGPLGPGRVIDIPPDDRD
jgi:UPF0716 protein FxsA